MMRKLWVLVLLLLLSLAVDASTILIDKDGSDWVGADAQIYEHGDYGKNIRGIKRVWVTHDAEYLYFRIDWWADGAGHYGERGVYLMIDTDSINEAGVEGFRGWVLPAKGIVHVAGTTFMGVAKSNGLGGWYWLLIEQNRPTEAAHGIAGTISEFRVKRSAWNLTSDDFEIRFALCEEVWLENAPGKTDLNYLGDPEYPEGYYLYRSSHVSSGDGAKITFTEPVEEQGLYWGQGEAGKTIYDDFRGYPARRTDLKTSNDSIYLSISREFHQSLGSGIDFEVTYYDEGTTPFYLEYYDAQDQLKASQQIPRGNTLSWKSVTFRLLDFAPGGKFGGNDLRIVVDSSDQEHDLYVHAVTAKGFATANYRLTVKDRIIGVPLPQVAITVSSAEYENIVFSTVTDNMGTAAFSDLPVGAYRVEISALGYLTQERELIITEDGTVEQAFELAKAANPQILIDGNTSDWIGNVRIYEHGDYGKGIRGIKRVWVTHDAEYLYFRIDWWADGAGHYGERGVYLMIDTDSINEAGVEGFRGWVLPAKGIVHVAGTTFMGVAKSNGLGGWYWLLIEQNRPTEAAHGIAGTISEFRVKRSAWNLTSDDFEIRFALCEEVWLENAPGKTDLNYLGDPEYPEGYYVYSTTLYRNLQLNPKELSARGNNKVNLEYDLQEAALTTIKILAPDGSLVETLAEREPQIGMKAYSWEPRHDGEPLPDGTYRVVLQFLTAADKQFEKVFNVKLVSTAPNPPTITYPLASGEHNLDWISLKGKTDLAGDALLIVEVNGAPVQVKVRGELLEKVPILKDGTFAIDQVYLKAGTNEIRLYLMDRYGNPSVKTEPLVINYNPNAAIGMMEIPYTSISPANGDGIQDEFVIKFNAAAAIEPELAIFQGETEVARILQRFEPGLVQLAWDGKSNGQFAADGVYSFVLTVAGNPSMTGTLTVKNTPPAKPELVWPNEGKLLSGANVSLQWADVQDAVAYRVTYGRNSDLVGATSVRVSVPSLELTNLDGGIWYWKVEAIDEAGNLSGSDLHSFEIGALDSSIFAIKNLGLAPNPFSPGRQTFREEVNVGFTLTQRGTVRVEIYNLRGRRLHTSFLGELEAGEHVAVWDGTDDRGGIVPQGSYIVRVVAESPVYAPRIADAKRIVVVLY